MGRGPEPFTLSAGFRWSHFSETWAGRPKGSEKPAGASKDNFGSTCKAKCNSIINSIILDSKLSQ